ncbi:MAG: PQQ-binding-like beta-propeller repeat protein [Verrucomicrobiota bacterium]
MKRSARPSCCRTLLLFFLASTLAATAAPDLKIAPDDWPWWRGPTRDGEAATGQNPPTTFSNAENVIWKAPVPGRGHASPTVVGKHVFLATADDEARTLSVLAYDRKTGKQLWAKEVFSGGFPEKIHKKNTHASATCASDGHHVFAIFYNDRKVQVVALDFEGKIAWKKGVGPFEPKKYEFGYGASPLLYKDWLVVVGDQAEGGFLAALDRGTGDIAWRIKRPADINYASPTVATIDGKDQLLIGGAGQISSYDPLTGKLAWAAKDTCPQTCGTLVADGGLIFSSGGYPRKETIAVKADGSGTIVWQNKRKCYEQSMLAHKGFVYAIDDGGILYCWRGKDGEEMWRERFGGPVSTSPVLVGDRIYAANEQGKFIVYKATPEKFEKLAENRLGDEAFATPAFCGNRIYARATHLDGDQRNEFLYCLGNE